MKTLAVACITTVVMGLGIGDAQSPPDVIDVCNLIFGLNTILGILPHS